MSNLSLARSFTRRINPATTAFFLCDIQERFATTIHGFSGVVSVAQKMTRAADILKVPLVVTEHYPKAMGLTVSDIDISKAALRADKTLFSMVIPPVQELLQERNTESVVLFGIESHVCILQTALDLLDSNYNVHVLMDGISSARRPEVPVAIARMQQAGAAITTSESIIYQLAGDAKHPQFKQLLQVVKDWQAKDRVNPLMFGQDE